MAVCQLMHQRLIHRYREQARSHTGLRVNPDVVQNFFL